MKTNLALVEPPAFDGGGGDGFVTIRLHRDRVDILIRLLEEELRRQGGAEAEPARGVLLRLIRPRPAARGDQS